MDFLANVNWVRVLVIASEVVAGASVLAAAISKYTENKVDDKIADALKWIKRNLLDKLAINS